MIAKVGRLHIKAVVIDYPIRIIKLPATAQINYFHNPLLTVRKAAKKMLLFSRSHGITKSARRILKEALIP